VLTKLLATNLSACGVVMRQFSLLHDAIPPTCPEWSVHAGM
jgi:hypothetical protein